MPAETEELSTPLQSSSEQRITGEPLQLASTQPMVTDTSLPDSRALLSAGPSSAGRETVEDNSLDVHVPMSKPPSQSLLTDSGPPLDHAAYTRRLAPHSLILWGSQISGISEAPLHTDPPRTMLTPLSQEEQPNTQSRAAPDLQDTSGPCTTENAASEDVAGTHDHVAVTEVVSTSTLLSPSTSLHLPHSTTPSSSLTNTVNSTEDKEKPTSHPPPELNQQQVIPELTPAPGLLAGDSPSSPASVQAAGSEGSCSIRQAWMIAQALSQTADSHTSQLDQGDDGTEASMEVSSHDEDVMEIAEEEASEAGIVSILTFLEFYPFSGPLQPYWSTALVTRTLS